MKLLKPKASIASWMADLIPIEHVELPFSRFMSPPKGSNNGVHFGTNILRHLKAREGV